MSEIMPARKDIDSADIEIEIMIMAGTDRGITNEFASDDGYFSDEINNEDINIACDLARLDGWVHFPS